MKAAFRKLEKEVSLFLKSVRTTRQICSLSWFFWKILEAMVGVQISVDVFLGEKNVVKSRKAVYLIGILLLVLFAVTFPDRILSILSFSQVDASSVLERTQGFIRAIKKVLPMF